MNEIILTEQPLTFVLNDTFGLYSWVTDTVMFTLAAGEQYTVTWDGTSYTCTAAAMTLGALSGIGLGNAGIVGGENTGEPFIFAYLPEYSQNAAFSADTETATHTVSIAKSGVEPDVPDTPTLGTDIVLYDRTGQAVVYRGIETITTDKPDTDEKATFTHGAPVDDAEVTLDLAGGDQQLAAPAGHVIRAATIKKPMTLEPENIKKGVNVAGVVGNFAGEETEKTVALSMADGDQVIEADEDTVMTKVTVTKPATLVPENIVDGIDIGGVVGNLIASSGIPAYGCVKYIIPITQNLSRGGSNQITTGNVTFHRSSTERIHVTLFPAQNYTATTSRYWAESIVYGCTFLTGRNYTQIYRNSICSWYLGNGDASATGNIESVSGNITSLTRNLIFGVGGSTYGINPAGYYYGVIIVTDTAYSGQAEILHENSYVECAGITAM